MLTVADLCNGERFKVKRIIVAKEVGKRLADMGFTKGAKGAMIRCALLKDPLEVRIYGYNVSIRRSEAEGIEIERLEPAKTAAGCSLCAQQGSSLLEKALRFCFPRNTVSGITGGVKNGGK